MSAEELTLDDAVLSDFKARLRRHLMTGADGVPRSIDLAVAALRAAARGEGTREETIEAAAAVVAVFPEIGTGKTGDRVRAATRAVRHSTPALDLEALAIGIAEVCADLLAARPIPGARRWPIAAGLLMLASRLPGAAESPATDDAAESGDLAATPEIIERVEALAAQLVPDLSAAAEALSGSGEIPGSDLVDRLDELAAVAMSLTGDDSEPKTVAAVLEALRRDIPQHDPHRDRAANLAALSGPDDAAEIVELVRALGSEALESPESADLEKLVAVVHAAVVCSDGVEQDIGALVEVSDALRTRGIDPLLLVKHVGTFQIAGEGSPAPPASTNMDVEVEAGVEDLEEFEDVGEPEEDEQAPADARADEEPAGAAPPETPATEAKAEAGGRVLDELAAESDGDASGTRIASDEKQPAEPAGADAAPSVRDEPSSAHEPEVVAPELAPPPVAPGSPLGAPELAELAVHEPMLASLIVHAEGGPRDLEAALQATALSRGLGPEVVGTAEELDRMLAEHHGLPEESTDDGALVAAAAVSLALHAPDASTLLPLNQPPAELAYLPAVCEALQGISAGVARGSLSRKHIDAATHQADAERRLKEITREAGELRNDLPKRDSRHRPARRVWRELISDHGELGSALKAISERTAEKKALEQLLHDWHHFDAHLDRVATELGTKARIVSGVRVWLEGNIRKVLDLIGRWLKATRELQAGTASGREGAHASFADERRRLASALDHALVELDGQIAGGGTLRAVCQGILRDRLYEARSALDGTWAELTPLPPNAVRLAPLARAWDLRLDQDGRPIGDPPSVVQGLVKAAERDPRHAIQHQLELGNLEAAEAALRVWALDAEAADVEARESDVREARGREADAIERLERELELQAARLLRFGIINADRHAQITGQLEDRRLGERGRFDLRRLDLEQVGSELRDGERERVAELQEKLDDTRAADEDRAQIQTLLDSGDYQIAEDFLLRLDRGETLKVVERTCHLEQFQECLELSQPDMRALADALKRGEALPGYPFDLLSEDERRRIREGLRALQSLEEAARQRQTKSEAAGQHLRAVGEVVGLDVVAASFKLRGRSPRGLSEATVDLIPGVATWRPPLHVSPEGPRKRRPHQVVVSAGAAAAQVLESIVGHPGLPALIVTATPISADRRRQLEREARRRSVAFLFVDPYVLAHCGVVSARDGVPPLDALIATSMALGKYNPYTAAGPVHHEMFMGRRTESQEVRDFGRAATVYGGRQLGKSALLRDIERAVNDSGDDRTPAALRARYIDLKREGVGDRLDAGAIWSVIGMSLAKAGVEIFGGRRDRGAVVEGIEEYLAEPLRELRLFLDEADDFLRAESQTGFPNVYALRQLVEGHQDRFKVVFAGLHSVNRFRRIPNQPLAQLGVPVRIGPLAWDEGRELVLTPLEALGYRFEDEALVDSILVETRRHPNLIQFACKRLVDHVASRADQAGESAPLVITREDLAEVFERDPEFREWLRERFELTLNLYRHYKVLALIIAMEAHADDRVRLQGLPLRELEGLAREWWPEGFANMTPDEFTVVVEEMENLEVLAVNRETGCYRLPSVNLIRLLGGSEEIERHLIAEIERPPEADEEGAQHDRRPLDGRWSSITYDDERRILGAEAAPISLVLGSEALGVDQLVADLEASAVRPEWNRTVSTLTVNVGDALPVPGPSGVVIAEVRPTPRPMTSVAAWLDDLARRDYAEGERVVLVFDGDWMPRWLELLDLADVAPGGQIQTTILKRWNPGAFRRVLEEMGATADRAAQWLATTGGYQVAVRELDADLIADSSADDRTRFADVLARSSGLDRIPLAARTLRELVDLGSASALDLKDLVGCSIVEADDACRILVILGLVRFEEDGYVVNDRVPAAEIAGLT